MQRVRAWAFESTDRGPLPSCLRTILRHLESNILVRLRLDSTWHRFCQVVVAHMNGKFGSKIQRRIHGAL